MTNDPHAGQPSEAVQDDALRHLMAMRERNADATTLRERQNALEHWLRSDPQHQAAWEQCQRDWAALAPLQARLLKRARRRQRRLIAGIAAALILLLTGFLIPPHLTSAPAGEHVTTSIGTLRTLQLTDGTTVTLDGATDLRFHVTVDQRSVTLNHGAAFFDVHHDPRRPFIIDTPRGRIEVLGTAFEIETWHDGLQVAVARGSVRVTPDTDDTPAVTLTREESVRYIGDAAPRRGIVPLEQIAGWRQGHMRFDNTPLVDVVRSLSRHYEDNILLSPRLSSQRLTLLVRFDQLDAAFAALPSVIPVRVFRMSDGLHIEPR